jgi:hypothetical protein
MITINAPTGEQFRKLIEYVNELVSNYNALEKRVEQLEQAACDHPQPGAIPAGGAQ